MKNIKFAGCIFLIFSLAVFLTACGSSSKGSNLAVTPTAVSVTPLNGEVAIAWSTEPNATSYNIYWSTTAGANTTTSNVIRGITGPPYVQTGLTNGTTYYYLVTSVSPAGESAALTSQESATPALSPAPTEVSATALSNQVTVSWQAVEGASSYNIYWSNTGGLTPATGTKISVPFQSSNYTQKGLANGTNYYYIVTAINSSGESMASSQANAGPSPSSAPYIAAKVFTLAGGGVPPWGWLIQVGVYTDTTRQTPLTSASVNISHLQSSGPTLRRERGNSRRKRVHRLCRHQQHSRLFRDRRAIYSAGYLFSNLRCGMAA
jgi:hypothetical protein